VEEEKEKKQEILISFFLCCFVFYFFYISRQLFEKKTLKSLILNIDTRVCSTRA